MTESLFLYSYANVFKMAENVFPVNTNVTIDGRGEGTIISHKNICLWLVNTSLLSITCWDYFPTAKTRFSFCVLSCDKKNWHSLSFHKVLLNLSKKFIINSPKTRLITHFLNSFNKTSYDTTTRVRSYIWQCFNNFVSIKLCPL